MNSNALTTKIIFDVFCSDTVMSFEDQHRTTVSAQEIFVQIFWLGTPGSDGDKDCILVFVRAKTPEIEKPIPPEFKGFTVQARESGIIYAEKRQRK